MRKIAAALLILFIAAAASAQEAEKKDQPKQRYNKVSFNSLQTDQNLSMFMLSNAGYQKSEEVAWLKYTENEFDFTRIWSPPPKEMILAKRTLSQLKTVVVSAGSQECQKSPRLLFLQAPAAKGLPPMYRLYAYEYNICDTSGILSPQDMLDQYIAKYGMYDMKDYNRDLVAYNNVRVRYKIGVRPMTIDDKKYGLTITVVDEEVFKEVYLAWLDTIKNADRKAQELF